MRLPTRLAVKTMFAMVLFLLSVAAGGRAIWKTYHDQAEIDKYVAMLDQRHKDFEARRQSRDVTLSNEFLSQVSPDVARLFRLIPRDQSGITDRERAVFEDVLAELRQDWKPTYAPMLVEISRWAPECGVRLFPFLEEQTGQKFGRNSNDWLSWIWKNVPEVYPDYFEFKGHLYSHIDKEYAQYFLNHPKSRIRADEIVWGGVMLEDIHRLEHPRMVPASEAIWLEDHHIVFGIEINGESRAYPRRIAASHEIIQDRVGGVEVVIPYCTMCESVNVYESEFEGVQYDLRTSGFLYRSNKLMYDTQTHSLWSSIAGEPKVGPLVDQNVKLKRHPVQTSTWKAWRESHPDTSVLSIETGFLIDYGEGEAYADFARSKKLWYPVPQSDDRLLDKQEVLAIPTDRESEPPLAISLKHLSENPVLTTQHGTQSILVLTDAGGGSRVYSIPPLEFQKMVLNRTIADDSSRVWQITDSALTSPGVESCPRLPAHRIYWLAWVNHHPDTVLISK